MWQRLQYISDLRDKLDDNERRELAKRILNIREDYAGPMFSDKYWYHGTNENSYKWINKLGYIAPSSIRSMQGAGIWFTKSLPIAKAYGAIIFVMTADKFNSYANKVIGYPHTHDIGDVTNNYEKYQQELQQNPQQNKGKLFKQYPWLLGLDYNNGAWPIIKEYDEAGYVGIIFDKVPLSDVTLLEPVMGEE